MTNQGDTINELRRQLRTLTEEATHNEAVLRRFQVRELTLLTADSLPELMRRLTEGMQESFGVDAIQLILADPKQEYRNLLLSTGIPAELLPNVMLVEDLHTQSPIYTGFHQPMLGNWSGTEHGPLFPEISALGSVALLPLIRDTQLMGSLNLGSLDPFRFTTNHAKDFLSRLATIAAVCIENMVNRERLTLSGLTDPLTGLHNRRYLERRLTEEVARAARYRQPLSCLFIDADHFKHINDTYGHAAGDTVLKELAQRVKSRLRTSDLAIRYGGEEFILLLPQTDREEAMISAERLRELIADNPISISDDQELSVTVSIGVSESCPATHTKNKLPLGDQLLIEADHALYRAKRQGRNQVALHKEGDRLENSDFEIDNSENGTF